ncbi:MAG: flippase, partial [Bacteroidota bacterium]
RQQPRRLVLALAQVSTVLVSLVLSAYLARILSPEGYGALGFALAFISYFVLAVVLGFNDLGSREIARNRSAEFVNDTLAHIAAMRLGLAVAIGAVYVGVVLLLPQPWSLKVVQLTLALHLFNQALLIEWVYIGLEKMGAVALRQVVTSVLYLVGVVLFVRDPGDVVGAAAAFVGSFAMGTGWLLWRYRRTHGFRATTLRADRSLELLRPALPLAGSGFMIAIYYNLDKVMLGFIVTTATVGLYEIGYKAFYVAVAPGLVLYRVFLPGLSSALGDAALMRERAAEFAAAMIAVGLPISVAGCLLAPDLIVMLGGESYRPGGTAARLLMANVAVVYLSMLFVQPLIAWNRQRRYMTLIAVGAVVNVLLNVLLIPRFEIEGAAVATLLSEAAVCLSGAYVHYRFTGALYVRRVLHVAVVVALTVGGAWWLGSGIGWPWPVSAVSMVGAYVVGGHVGRVFDVGALWSLLRARGQNGGPPSDAGGGADTTDPSPSPDGAGPEEQHSARALAPRRPNETTATLSSSSPLS